jgi:AcrR family transcriptional regulator
MAKAQKANTSGAKKPAGSRKGREPLTRDRIAVTALDLIEKIGLEAFSTRRLGAALGCEAMALYNHYPSKGAVLDAVVERMMRKLTVPPPDPRGWSERARTFARSYRALSRLHPQAFPLAATRRFNTSESLAFLDAVFGAFSEDGLSSKETLYVFRTVANFCNGTVLDELAGLSRAAEVPEQPEWPGSKHANLVEVAPFMSPTHFDDVFEVGLSVILDGLVRQIAAWRAPET